MTINRLMIATACVLACSSSIALAARKKKPAPKPPMELTEKGKQLEATYAKTLSELKAQLDKALPTIDDDKKAAYLKARDAEKVAEAVTNAKLAALKKYTDAPKSLARQQSSKEKAVKGLADAENALKQIQAKADDDKDKAKALKKARSTVAKAKSRLDKALKGLKDTQETVDNAKTEVPKLTKEIEAAKNGLAQAQAQTMQAVKDMGVDSLLSSDKLDAQLVKYVVMSEATPRGLAEFAQTGEAQEALLKTLLSDTALMIQMMVADGAKDGKYGQAMAIYTAIQKASPKAKDGCFQRLALAISLEHAVPLSQRNPTGAVDAPVNVDPIKRYLHFEKAYLDNDLDPGFKVHRTWDYRMVVNGNEPDETLAWGRTMLRNYRPDHITTSDDRWRYVKTVKTDVRYGSQDNKYDKPDQQFFQNILMNGGICGRRAFFGRFILRAFGVPTTARPQPGHAALAHWTPDGWVVCLGAGWKWGSTHTRYRKDLDFLASTQARENPQAYLRVKRAQWIGTVMGETPVYGLFSGDPDFWYGVSLFQQKGIIEKAKAVALAAVGTDIGEANESKVKEALNTVTIPEEDKRIVTAKDGSIIIPAVACTKPTTNTPKIVFMKSKLGGMQLHYNRLGKEKETFEYVVDVPQAGKYQLTARVVTPSWKQHLSVAANGAKESVDIALPYTVGMWDKTEPVEVQLLKGKNVLTFSRDHENLKGVTIKDFTLNPVVN